MSLVHFFMTSKGYQPIDPPRLADEISCPFCGETTFFTFLVEKDKLAWGCGRVCMPSRLPNEGGGVPTHPEMIRALPWSKFCEINGIGDEHYDVKFESINQNEAKLSYMLKFAQKPRGIILMRGDTGAGKTYASMGMCEYYTRYDTSCMFTTAKQMMNDWLFTFKEFTNYVEKTSNVCLLVIDDFGTSDPPPGFLTFFMELINTRMQWTNRGTVISTNLEIKKLNEICGNALIDRIMTGQQFEFKEKTRRKKTIL
jgi:DNA replication protein DnaC